MSTIKSLLVVLMCICFLPLGHTKESPKFKLGLNLLAIHGFDRSENYHNSLDNQGIFMYAKYVYLKYDSHYFVVGKDSIGSNMVGYMYEYNNFIIGAYSYNRSDWDEKKHESFYGEKLGFIPYVGYKVEFTKEVNFIFNPILSTLNFEF